MQNRLFGFGIISVALVAAVLALANAEGYRPAFGFVQNLQRATVVVGRELPSQQYVPPVTEDCGEWLATESPLTTRQRFECWSRTREAIAEAIRLAQTPSRQVFFEQSLGNVLAMCLGLGLVGAGVAFFRPVKTEA